MANLSNNVKGILAKFDSDIIGFTGTIDQAVKAAAFEFLSDCITEIDGLIYSTPESPDYHRTKHLRRSHHVRRITAGTYLIFNDAGYSFWVHEGCYNQPYRPWMDNAMDKNLKKYEETVGDMVGEKVGAT